MFTRSIVRHSAALAVLGFVGLAGSAQAATYNLDFAGIPPYCSTACLGPGHLSAGTVDVTVNTTGSDFLQVHVSLASGFRFLDNHNFTFAFSLNVAGASIENVVGNNGAIYLFPPNPVSGDAGDGVGGNFTLGLIGDNFSGAGKVDSTDLTFDVKKAGTDLSLDNLIATLDKNGNLVFFIADVGFGANTGYVGAQSCINCAPPPPGTPIPGALPLFVSGMGVLGFFGWRRKRQLAKQAA